MIAIWSRMLVFDGTHYWAGFVNIWGDWSAHIIYVMNFAYRSLILPHHPLYVGEPFRYHFVADLLSGVLMRSGATLIQATILPSIILSIFLVTAAYLFYRSVFNSRAVAMVSCLLFFFNGGLGFIYAFVFFVRNDSRLYNYPPLFQLTHIESENIQIINFIADIFIPQRSFLLGMPITIFILLFLWNVYVRRLTSLPNGSWIMAAFVIGLMPLIHFNSFLVILIVGASVTIYEFFNSHTFSYRWLIFYSIIGIIASPALLYLTQNAPQRFFRFSPLWMTNGNLLSWVWFWIKNIGIMAVLIPESIGVVPKRIRVMYIPFLLLFIASNLIVFQSYEWDNRKYILYWYFFSSGMVGYMMVLFFRRGSATVKNVILFLVGLAIVSGSVDAANLTRFEYQKFRLFSIDDLKFSKYVRQLTDKDAIFLTAPTNSWFSITLGRQVVMGLTFWMHTAYGFDTEAREAEITKIYEGSKDMYALLDKYHVDFVVIGDRERETIPDVNETFYRSRFPVFMHNADTVIYDVRETWSQ